MFSQDIIFSNCCDHPVAFLSHTDEELYQPNCHEVKPHWIVITLDPRYSFRGSMKKWIVVEFCPNCGKKLPDVVKKEHPPEKIFNCKDGGYRCDTCGERNHACECACPHLAWEIKG